MAVAIDQFLRHPYMGHRLSDSQAEALRGMIQSMVDATDWDRDIDTMIGILAGFVMLRLRVPERAVMLHIERVARDVVREWGRR